MKALFKFACVYCGQHLECESGMSGRQIRCPACGHCIVIPETGKVHQINRQPLGKFNWDTEILVPKVMNERQDLKGNHPPRP